MGTFTIARILTNGTADVTFSIDGKTQNIDNLPLQDAEGLKTALDVYAVTYETGVAQALADSTVATIPATVQALVGKPQIIPGV